MIFQNKAEARGGELINLPDSKPIPPDSIRRIPVWDWSTEELVPSKPSESVSSTDSRLVPIGLGVIESV